MCIRTDDVAVCWVVSLSLSLISDGSSFVGSIASVQRD